MPEQLEFQFSKPSSRLPELWSVDEIYESISARLVSQFAEDRRLERKSARITVRALGDEICAYANAQPDGGIILVGVEDDGEITGCAALDTKKLNALERAASEYCPEARMDSKRIPALNSARKDDYILVFRILYRRDKLVETTAGEALVRDGDRKRRLGGDEKREIRISKGEIDFELEPSVLSWPYDFDQDLVDLYCKSFRAVRVLTGGQSNEEILCFSNLGEMRSGKFIPNIACSLMFGTNVTREFPGCRIRFLRFQGVVERTGIKRNVTKDLETEGCVPTLIAESERIVESQLRDFTRLSMNGKFYTRPEYPKDAWYEAIVNACVHRSYNLRNMNIFVKMFDDRLVIQSPGGFPPPVTAKNIYQSHNPRNPHLMQAMRYLNFVQCANEGTRRIRDRMVDENLPEPIFEQREADQAQVFVTLRNDVQQRKEFVDADAMRLIGEQVFEGLSENEKRIVNCLAEQGRINVSDTQRLTGRGWAYAKKLLDGLAHRGIISRVSNKKSRDPKAHYVLRQANGNGEE